MTVGQHDPVDVAMSQLSAAGLLIERLIIGPPPAGKKVNRVDVEGQKRGKLNGWYVCDWFRLDNGQQVIVGSYGVWVARDPGITHLEFEFDKSFSDAERERLRVEQARLREIHQADLDDQRAAAAAKAAAIWPKLPDHGHVPYLQRKQVRMFGCRIGRNGSLVVPVRRPFSADLLGLQFIQPDGDKRFLTGTPKQSAAHLIADGDLPKDYTGNIGLAEGYATAATCHEATGWPVFACFDCGNLMMIARIVHAHFPKARQVVFADNDQWTMSAAARKAFPKDFDFKGLQGDDPFWEEWRAKGWLENAGCDAAFAILDDLGAAIALPPIPHDDPSRRTDWNDLHCSDGLDAVRAAILAPDGLITSRPILTQDIGPAPTDDSGALAPPGAGVATDADADSWRKQLVYTKSGMKAAMWNVLHVMRAHPLWTGVFGYDAFAKRIVKLKPAPFGGPAGLLSDIDETQAAAWFGRRDTFGTDIRTGTVREVIAVVAADNSYHPVRDYLTALCWDGTDRLDTFFSDFCDVPQSTMSAGFARNFFLQGVARIFDPGCKADLMLVLEGDQGARKSTLAKVLAGAGNYADVGTAPSDKDFYQIIQGTWLVEISEMASFAKAENSHIKRAISVDVDKFRKSYGHNVEEFPRECVFFGTVNNSDWQRDETGGRRYMPVWVGEIDIDGVRLVRDQLWAEAVHRYKAGEPWWWLPDGAHEAQEERYIEDVWAEPVLDYLRGRVTGPGQLPRQPREKVTISELLTYALEMDVKKQDRGAQTRMGNLMRRLGWSMRQRRIQGATTKIREYFPPAPEKRP